MRILSFALIGFALVYSTMSNASVFGGSNLGFSGYPEFSDSEPSPLTTVMSILWEHIKGMLKDIFRMLKTTRRMLITI